MEENQCVMLGCNHLCECLGLEQCYHPIWKQAQATPERRLFQLVPFWEESVSPLAVGCPGLSNMQAGTSAVPVLRAVHLDVIFIFSLSSLACQG